MATLVLTTIGTIVGGPIGGAIGAMVGQQIDQRLFAPKGRQGPRLNDLTISEARLAAKVGRTIEVLIDEVQGETAIGRSHADAPEIDGQVSVAGAKLKVGQRVKAQVTHADTYDLFATVTAGS